ncbi:hypothetical protein Vretimale_12910 [Volvox reticuliferus]|uniref:Uncharacterized protein n=1 Tax=Volvox reticuliferus TaxID=1737510 RepID=A0A8J4LTJ5_9CHLO|nr:hypothetical protein Vretifemale_9273 [Volvox reticuliferus]GIM09022.1 hypothetical protein Vretimale_12910 [Volvox reticuliferus]
MSHASTLDETFSAGQNASEALDPLRNSIPSPEGTGAQEPAATAQMTENGHGVTKSASFLDVRSVDASSVPPLKRSKLSTVVNLLEARTAVQEHENEIAEVVIVCEPEQASLMMGGLHPRGSLYERPINIDTAKQQHAEFRKVLREHGVRVLTVREILAHNVDTNMSARVDLEELAFEALKYVMAQGHDLVSLAEEDRHYLSDVYKREVISAMSTTQLIDTVMTNPTVSLLPSYRDTGLTASYRFEPLSNLVYTRDQQITTCRGIVMGRLRSAQRQREVQVMRFCFNKLGMAVAGEIREPGYLEGGDFFPMGSDLAMAGIGLRSNIEACKQLMDEDLLGTRRFAVVRDEFDQHQDRMHLDCVFSVLSDHCCIMLADIMGEASPTRRLVDEYTRDPASGKYKLTRENVEFSAFISGEGYHIIPISNEHQLQYACNVLNLGESRIISVHAQSARQIVKDPRFNGDVQVLDFSSITSMYGSVHCASQVVKRIPRSGK